MSNDTNCDQAEEAAEVGVPQFRESTLNEPCGEYGLKQWTFNAAMVSSYGAVFADCEDNYEVTDVLRKAKVLGKNDKDDPESCCSYFYFESKRDAQAFLRRLNRYMIERAKKLQALAEERII